MCRCGIGALDQHSIQRGQLRHGKINLIVGAAHVL